MSLLIALLLACGTEDWAQKTLTDADGIFVGEHGSALAVSYLRTVAKVQPNLHVVEEVEAYVTAWKLEADGDIHAVISDTPGGPTMIAEFPDDECTKGSPHAAQMAQARADFVKLFGKPGAVGRLKKLAKPVRVRLEGVVYFDHLHGQTGVAPNGIELHPVLSLKPSNPEALPQPSKP